MRYEDGKPKEIPSSRKDVGRGRGTRPSAPDVDWSIRGFTRTNTDCRRSKKEPAPQQQPSQKPHKLPKINRYIDNKRSEAKNVIENHVGKANEPPEKPKKKGVLRKAQTPKRTKEKSLGAPEGGGGDDTSQKALFKAEGKRLQIRNCIASD